MWLCNYFLRLTSVDRAKFAPRLRRAKLALAVCKLRPNVIKISQLNRHGERTGILWILTLLLHSGTTTYWSNCRSSNPAKKWRLISVLYFWSGGFKPWAINISLDLLAGNSDHIIWWLWDFSVALLRRALAAAIAMWHQNKCQLFQCA